MRQASFICMTWRTHMQHAAFICNIHHPYSERALSYLTCLIRCLIHTWHASFIRDMHHSYSKPASFIPDMSHSYGTWFNSYVTCLIHTQHAPHSYLACLIHIWHTSFTCDMPHAYVTYLIHTYHNSFICEIPESTWMQSRTKKNKEPLHNTLVTNEKKKSAPVHTLVNFQPFWTCLSRHLILWNNVSQNCRHFMRLFMNKL